jgi:hypothetical protein
MKIAEPRMEEKEQTAGVRRREITLKRHMTVRIPRGIVEAMEGFLKTEKAVKMGFDSKADVVTAAIRNLLSEYGYYRKPQKKVRNR